MQIKVKVFDKACTPKINDQGDWIDLRAREDMVVFPWTQEMIPLGVAMELPEGYEAHVAPRSSTFRKYGIIQTNGVGVIDNSYSGPDDEWFMPVYGMYNTQRISKGDRICQFRIVPKQPTVFLIEDDLEGNENRGGNGSTGRQ